MKIERVSDTQLKLTLTKADLAERDIQLEDLIRPGGCAFPRTLTLEQSEKAERLRQQRTRIKERMSCL